MIGRSAELLDDAIAQVNETPNVSFVMFTGDLIDKPFEKELNAFLPHVQKLNVPWYFAFGNHDTMVGGYLNPSNYMQIVNEYNKNYKFEKTYYSFVPQKGYKAIVLDTIIRDRLTSNGRLGDEQLAWLDNELKNSQKDTVLIFMHVPVIEPYVSPNHRLLDADKMEEILNKYKNPIAVFQGHYHGAKITQKDNILYVSCPSMVTYPNAFRMITVTNFKNKVTFEIQDKETRLKDVQKLAKLLIFAANFYTGGESDRNATVVIKK
jgi:3',5'-cyclic AMP phosphodiesterase CpdA